MRNYFIVLFLLIGLLQHSCKHPHSVYYAEGFGSDVPTLKILGYTGEDSPPLISAHRGGKRYEGWPENSLELFEYVLSYTPAIIECDVSVSKDGVLILMHDESLERTTTGKGLVRDTYWSSLKDLKLVDDFGTVTDFRIPKLENILEWADNRGVLLMLDLKGDIPFEVLMELIKDENAIDNVVIISENASEAHHLFEFEPEIKQSVTIEDFDQLKKYLDAGIPPAAMVAFVGTEEPDKDLYDQLHDLGMKAILGTMGKYDNKAIAHGDDEYRELHKDGADIIATDRPIEAAAALEVFGSKPLVAPHQED